MTEDDEIDRIAARDREPAPARGNAAKLRVIDPPAAPPARKGARRMTISAALDDLEIIKRLPIYPTPFDTLNQALGLGGLVCGYPHILAGGTGKGKTTLILDLARHHATHHGPVLIVSLEMRGGHLVARATSSEVRCSTNEILRGERSLVREDVPLPDSVEIVETCTLAELDETIEQMTEEYGGRAPLVVVDYLQKLVDLVMQTMERPDARLATSMVSAALLGIARRRLVPMVVVSSVSRGSGARIRGSSEKAGKRTDPRSVPPEFYDDVAKESGSIEYDAAALMVLHVSDEIDADGFNVATLTLAKARFGMKIHIAAAYDGPGGRWHDRGKVERIKVKTPGIEEVTAERAAELNALGAAIMKALESGPKSRKKLADELKRRKADIADAAYPLLRAGALRDKGSGAASRLELVATTPDLPGIGAAPTQQGGEAS